MEQGKTPPKVSAGKVKWLLGELPGWVAEGFLAQEAADKIAERYRQAQAASGRTKLIYVLGTMAALLLGTGVILFFASNWEYIGRFGKPFVCSPPPLVLWNGDTRRECPVDARPRNFFGYSARHGFDERIVAGASQADVVWKNDCPVHVVVTVHGIDAVNNRYFQPRF